MLRLLVCLLSLTLAFAARKPVTPEFAAETRPSAGVEKIVWAPDGQAFLYQISGVLYLYRLEDRERQQLLKLSVLEIQAHEPPEPEQFPWQNRRVREEPVQWFPDGERLLLKVEGDLFIYDIAGKDWRQFTATDEDEADPKLSPDGRQVSFRRGSELYAASIDSGRVRRLTHDATATRWNGKLDWVYPEELDLGTAHWWSPDSRHIAYLQFDVARQYVHPHIDLLPWRAVFEPQRFPKAGTPNADVRLGVVSTPGGKTRWLETAAGDSDLIARVHWAPGSSGLLVQKLNRIQNKLRLDLLPLKGSAKTILLEEDPHWINVSDDLRVLEKSDRLLWSSERTGYRHLYLHGMDGGEPTQFTSGDWEVTGITGVDEDNGVVYFESTAESPLERHLYRVKLDGTGFARLTQDGGTNAIDMAPGCGHYIQASSSLTQPLNRTLHSIDGKRLDELQPPDTALAEEYEILPSEIVTVNADDGDTLYARLVRPAGFESGKTWPAIVRVYGGPHAQSVVDKWFGADLTQALAHAGFVVWELDNRGTSGRGHKWETRLFRRFGRQELADQLVGLRHLIAMGFVDPKRVGIHGWSYGGFMTLYAMIHGDGAFQAGVAGAPVTDWKSYDTIYTERYLGLPEENEEGYQLGSPLSFPSQLKGDLLFIHNIEDDNVLFQHTLRMADALQKAGKPFEMMIYPQKTHGVEGEVKKHFYRAVVDFFERGLLSTTGS